MKKTRKARTIVIGDVHGCYNELRLLVGKLIGNNIYKHKTDKLIFLGDYIDRGEDSRLVISYIRNLQNTMENVITLMGNHEDMALDFFNASGNVNDIKYYDWYYNGCEATLKSYEGCEKELKSDLEWMKNLLLYYEDDNFIYVHAGIDKRLPMNKQRRNTLLWAREEFIYDTKEYDKRVIFGHTPKYSKPYCSYGNDICIDSGCVYGGTLTALVIEDGEVIGFHSVNSGEGKTNTFTIMAQAFYGNNVSTEIHEEDIDRFILGYLNSSDAVTEKIDRTVVDIPNTDGLKIIYNKYQNEEWKAEFNSKVLANIPEKDIKIYGRCIACRFDGDGNLTNLRPNDLNIVKKYFVA